MAGVVEGVLGESLSGVVGEKSVVPEVVAHHTEVAGQRGLLLGVGWRAPS